MTQSEVIIGKFGGIRPLARALKHKHASTVQGWKESGFIPADRQPEVLALAKKLSIPLSPDDFFNFATTPTRKKRAA